MRQLKSPKCKCFIEVSIMNSCWLLTLCISVFLIIMTFTNCEGHSENYFTNLHNSRHRDKHLLDPQSTSPEKAALQSTGTGFIVQTPVTVSKGTVSKCQSNQPQPDLTQTDSSESSSNYYFENSESQSSLSSESLTNLEQQLSDSEALSESNESNEPSNLRSSTGPEISGGSSESETSDEISDPGSLSQSSELDTTDDISDPSDPEFPNYDSESSEEKLRDSAEEFSAEIPPKIQSVGNSKPYSEDICLTPGCIHAASTMLNYIDLKVEPCDNFYEFACGNFLKSRVIPDDKTSISSFTDVSDKLHEQLRIIIEEESKPDELKPFRVVKSLYKSCMNKSAIEEKGFKLVLDILNKLGGWPVLESDLWQEEKFDWKQSVYELRELGFSTNYFLSLNVEIDLKNNTKRMLTLDEADLSLPRKNLVKGLSDKIVDAYYRYMIDIAVILGANRTRAEKELKESLEFEMKLANISLPQEERRNITVLYNPMTLKDFKGNYTTIPWSEYINRILKIHRKIDDEDVVIVASPTYFQKFEKLMQKTSKKIQANYLLWRAVAASVSFLTEKIRKRQLDYSTVRTGVAERKARWKECLAFTSREMGESVGALYVRKYFSEESKKSVVEMVSDIRQELNKILQEVHWMDNKTRINALEKADAMRILIAYPDELLDDNKLVEFYDKLEITPGDFHQMMLNISLFRTEYSFSQLITPVEKLDWVNFANPAVVNAFYSSVANSIKFPAGILQGIFFNNERPRYMNYAAIGWVIGHEMTHGFDDRGRQFDKEGNLIDWWEPQTKEKYLKKAECFIYQYGNYTAKEVGLNLNGIITQGENIADNGGIKEAYLAYQEWVKRNSRESMLPGLNYTSSQFFWISAAQMWCTKSRSETLKLRVMNGMHSLEEFRVLGSFSNSPEFSKDFKCPEGSRMNPLNKCSIW